MSILVEAVSAALLAAGAGFVIIGTIGLLRLPDAITQLHAAGITDTLGVGLIILGLVVKAGVSLVSVKLLAILVVLVFTNPAAGHAIARAVEHYRSRSWGERLGEDS